MVPLVPWWLATIYEKPIFFIKGSIIGRSLALWGQAQTLFLAAVIPLGKEELPDAAPAPKATVANPEKSRVLVFFLETINPLPEYSPETKAFRAAVVCKLGVLNKQFR